MQFCNLCMFLHLSVLCPLNLYQSVKTLISNWCWNSVGVSHLISIWAIFLNCVLVLINLNRFTLAIFTPPPLLPLLIFLSLLTTIAMLVIISLVDRFDLFDPASIQGLQVTQTTGQQKSEHGFRGWWCSGHWRGRCGGRDAANQVSPLRIKILCLCFDQLSIFHF